MIDKMAISGRFFQCYPGMSRSVMARLFKVRSSTVTAWATRGIVPWSKLKYLSDSKAISWDWLLAGVEPRESVKEAKTPRSTRPKFNTIGINRRFLSLFPGMSQTQISERLEITPAAVHEWHKNKSQVSWERLADAISGFGVRWDWFIDGVGPKYRE